MSFNFYSCLTKNFVSIFIMINLSLFKTLVITIASKSQIDLHILKESKRIHGINMLELRIHKIPLIYLHTQVFTNIITNVKFPP